MNTNIKLWTVLTAGFLAISGCGDNTSTPSTHDQADSTVTEHHSSDSMSHESTKDTAIAGGHGLMTAMNTMMDKMSAVQMTGDFDIDFANMMIEHHKGAVEMANIELSKGTDAKMKSIAQNIITQQTDEINMLQKAIANHKS